MTESNSESTGELKIPCRSLRSKEMYYHGSETDEFSSGLFWCQKTHESFGPDGQPAAKPECCGNRACYRA